MDTEPLFCAWCIRELSDPDTLIKIDSGKSQRGPGPERAPVAQFLRWATNYGAPIEIGGNPLMTLYAVTLVRGTAVCAAHVETPAGVASGEGLG